MSLEALDALIVAEADLIAALDGKDIDALESAVASLGAALRPVRAQGAWHDLPEVADTASRALALVEAARVRVLYLADRNRRRIELLSAAVGKGGVAISPAYGRTGRIG